MRSCFFCLIIFLITSCQQQREEKIVGVVILNDFEQQYIESITKNIESYYKCRCVLLGTTQLPDNCITTIKERRYRADSIIRYLASVKPDSIDYILGLTNENICITKKDKNGNVRMPEAYFIDISALGLGFCPGKSCVVSSFNFKNAKEDLIKARLQKITIHELGHNFGLPHCKNEDCVIRDGAETAKILDDSDTKLCEECCKKIKRMIR